MLKLVYSHVVTGGAETLLLRIAEMYGGTEKGVELYCSSITKEMYQLFKGASVKIIQYGENFEAEILSPMPREDVILTLTYDLFYICQRKLSEKYQVNVFLYVVHMHALTEFVFRSPRRSLFKQYFRNELEYNVKARRIFFMDRECVDKTAKYYRLESIIDSAEVLFLPMKSTTVEQYAIQERRKDFKILAVARADFPFKGYMKGLIDIYVHIKRKYENITLTIISDGGKLKQLSEWIDEANTQVAGITLLENINYRELPQYYKKASVYVGMGTTIIEASNQAVIAIPVQPYITECKTSGYFHDNPEQLCADSITCEDATKYIENVIEMNDDQFLEASMDSKKAFENNYSIDIILKKLEVSYIKGKNADLAMIFYMYKEKKIRKLLKLLKKLVRKIQVKGNIQK